jgi:hypothetical protein|tara:strand:- start:1267 stop:1668 length:402 start_codon:yes stop_codon:yes gene_type:complete
MSIGIQRMRLIWAFLLMGTLSFASHWHVAPAMPGWDLFEFDKLAHFPVYGLLATLIARALTGELKCPSIFGIAWASTVGFGMVDETIQSMNPVRDFSLADLVADAAGTSVALLPISCGRSIGAFWSGACGAVR